MGTLRGKVAIVTGAGQGLGEGIARRLAAEGATVICTDARDPSRVADSLPGASAAVLDISDADAVDQVTFETVDRFGRIDILCNNAGIGDPAAEVVDSDVPQFRRTFEVNFFGTLHCCRAVGRVMRTQKSGRIITIASRFAKESAPKWGAYAASKAALVSLTQTLAVELGPYGITANAVLPGTMITPKAHELVAAFTGTVETDHDEYFATYARDRIPVGRMGGPADVGAMVAWLSSDDASFVTGAALNLTGGESLFF